MTQIDWHSEALEALRKELERWSCLYVRHKAECSPCLSSGSRCSEGIRLRALVKRYHIQFNHRKQLAGID